MHPEGHCETPKDLDNAISLTFLAAASQAKFWELKELADLDDAITVGQIAFKLCPPGHVIEYLCRHNLASNLCTRFEMLGSMADLDEAAKHGRATVEHSVEETRLKSLATVGFILSRRFSVRGETADIDTSIDLWREASRLCPPSDPHRLHVISSLARALYLRFNHQRDTVDLQQAIDLAHSALELAPPGHPDHSKTLLVLTSLHRIRVENSDITPDGGWASELRRAVLAPQLNVDQPKSANNSVVPDVLRDSNTPENTIEQDAIGSYGAGEVGMKDTSNSSADSTAGNMAAHANISHFQQLLRDVVFETLEKAPPRMLNTRRGILCDKDAQLSSFEASQQYKKLLSGSSEPAEQLEHIRATVADYFQYATLSHRWGKEEPLLREIEGKVIYDMPPTDGLVKLQSFCRTALQRGYLWAWSDTCCIDKVSSAELQEAIGTMFSWYWSSALTITYLPDVTATGSLTDSVWLKRGWTLQELLAPRTLLFYTQDWSLYVDQDASNHKENDVILHELSMATGIASRYLTDFYPSMEEARTRLQWASTRRTTRPEDIAYSLFGIFKVHLPVLYGESKADAMGRLLAEIISRSGDTSVLDWVGQASPFHSCFPADIAAYQMNPYVQPIPSDVSVGNMRKSVSAGAARRLRDALARLPLPRFINRRLTLPCIMHRVTTVKLKRRVYEIHAMGLEPLEIPSSSATLQAGSGSRLPYVLIHAWHASLLDTSTEDPNTAAYRTMAKLEQPFSSLLLVQLPHNEYKRIASDCTIIARASDPISIAKSETKMLHIV
ncbi:hypothetical protein ID866_10444 [Astraeus odoratus]|nr:hypothetical protein ID866_10444 [Astraeus odoratus]